MTGKHGTFLIPIHGKNILDITVVLKKVSASENPNMVFPEYILERQGKNLVLCYFLILP